MRCFLGALAFLPLLDTPRDAGHGAPAAVVTTSTRGDVPAVGEVAHRDLDVEITTAEDGLRSTFQIMSGLVARDGWIVEPDGGSFEAYERNNVVLWQHGYSSERGYLPIGRGVNLTRNATGWTADVEYEEDEFALRVAGMVKRGTLSSVSIGWRTLEASWQVRDEREVYVITRWELTEFSIVAVPADTNAVALSRATPVDARQSADIARLTERIAELEAERQAPTADVSADTSTPAPAAAVEPAPIVPSPRAATPEEYAAVAVAFVQQVTESTLRALGRA